MKGFVCCGKPMGVTRTLRPCAGQVVRYRKCAKCFRIVKTVEKTVEKL